MAPLVPLSLLAVEASCGGEKPISLTIADEPSDRSVGVWWVLLGARAVFASLALMRRRFNHLRAWGVIVTPYLLAAFAVARLGFLLGPAMTLGFAVVVSRLFVSARVAWALLGLATTTLVGIGYALTHDWLPPVDAASSRRILTQDSDLGFRPRCNGTGTLRTARRLR
ncbi:MAG: hypothetical protein JW940_25390, partial [Polyangiaceae bacterium]|nr:hypothetical protein [Polyangiaceae bacterium]